jgi:hypothetical protein
MSQDNLCRIFGRQDGSGVGFSLGTAVFLRDFQFHQYSILLNHQRLVKYPHLKLQLPLHSYNSLIGVECI